MSAIALAALLLASTPAPGASTRSADDFLQRVYAGYARANSQPAPFERLTTPALRALIARDEAAHPGEIGDYDDIDWICRCQDWTGIRVINLASRSSGGAVISRVSFRDVGAAGAKLQTVQFKLVRSGRDWRIADVMLSTTSGERWASIALAEEIRRITSH